MARALAPLVPNPHPIGTSIVCLTTILHGSISGGSSSCISLFRMHDSTLTLFM